MAYCKKCLLPDNVPGADLDKHGICKFCREYSESQTKKNDDARKEYETDLEQALQDCRGIGEHDCLVPLSGGKDSVYLLYKLKVEYGLNVLAFTTNVNIPDLAWKNIRNCLKKLDIDHISYTPSYKFYTKLFRHLLKNQEERGAVYTISYVYAPLFEGDAIKLAMQKNIPLILAGYSPGQPEPERMLYEFSPKLIRETDWTPPALRRIGPVFQPAQLSGGHQISTLSRALPCVGLQSANNYQRSRPSRAGFRKKPRQPDLDELSYQLAFNVLGSEEFRIQSISPRILGAYSRRQSKQNVLADHDAHRKHND
jgi:hypothetical protein